MFNRTLKKISDFGYDISWRYDSMSNSIIMQARKGDYIIDRKICFDMDSRVGGSASIEFYIKRYLIEMLHEIEIKENNLC